MAQPLTTQLERLSYTRRDLELIDAEVDRFITQFIPVIKNTGKANAGRLFLRVLEALVDKINYSQDMRFRQSVLRTVTELQSALDITELVRYVPAGVSSATADLTVNTLTSPAPVGGIPISQYQVFATSVAPIKQFIALESAVLPAGATSLYPLPVVEGIRIVDQVIQASTTGAPNEEVTFPVSKTPHEFIEIKVDGTLFIIKDDLKDSEPEDRHCMLRDNEDKFTTIMFGDGTYGAKLSPGSVVAATYIQSQGEAGNTPKGFISTIVGGLSALISATNTEQATGGFDGDIVEDVVRKAPLFASAARGANEPGADHYRASNDKDFEILAQKLVPGVFSALAEYGVGPLINLYIMPAGGGVASSYLLQTVKQKLTPRAVHGVTINAKSLLPSNILIKMDVSLQSNKVNKSLARRRVFETISAYTLDNKVNTDGALYFKNLTIGRGFAFSDMDSLLEDIDNKKLIDFVNYSTFTRYPTPIATNLATTVLFDGEVEPQLVADYASWTIVATSTTQFTLFKNGFVDSLGTVGVLHASNDGSIKFTLGQTTDAFVPSVDVWSFKTSAYRNNMLLDPHEFMELSKDSDLQISIYYPGELSIG
jgi:hypothetical protein